MRSLSPTAVLTPARRARAARVARGLLDPEQRPRYVAAARQRADWAKNLVYPGSDGAPRCMVCRSRRVSSQQATFTGSPAKSFRVTVCRKCGYVANPENFNDYTVYQSLEQFPVSARVGTLERPGREWHMAKMGLDILGENKVDILIVGPGRSMDYRHIEKLPGVRRVAIGDIMQLHDVPDFVNLLEDKDQRFDLVLASEVIEHFTDPARDFPGLFRMLRKRGILICSTNVWDGGNLNKHAYLYIKGHTSYYSAQTLSLIARENQMFVDFRLPVNATTFAGPRKRYVLFTKSADRMRDISLYFGRHPYAPSER